MRQEALKYARAHSDEALEGLQTLLRFPSVSTLPKHQPDVQQTARWLADKVSEIGLENVQVMPTPGHPLVYADWLQAGPDRPTLLIYGHYDVQPVDPLEEWKTSPFEPVIEGEHLYGRGASDNKGQLYIHLAALTAYFNSSGALPLNVKLLFEGEEESGSINLESFVKTHRDLLTADAALISDTAIIDPDTPTLITGVRGLVYMEISLRGSKRDLHSGTYGGVVQNPLNVMAEILAALRDESGRITIPGFYNKVRELSTQERKLLNRGAPTEAVILERIGAPALWGEAGYTVAERMGVRPTLDVHGIRGGFTETGAKTVIPATAMAKVSMRLAPSQKPAEIVELFTEYIHQITPPTMEVAVKRLNAAVGAEVDIEAPALQAGAEAYERVFGRPPVYLREGGTLPIVGMLINLLEAPVVLMGFGLPDDALHAPNERFYLPNFYRGIETAIHYYDIFAQM